MVVLLTFSIDLSAHFTNMSVDHWAIALVILFTSHAQIENVWQAKRMNIRQFTAITPISLHAATTQYRNHRSDRTYIAGA